jgi:site-specific recombinase XerC
MYLLEPSQFELVVGHPPVPLPLILARLPNPHLQRTYKLAIQQFLVSPDRDATRATKAAVEGHVGELTLRYPPDVVAQRLFILQRMYDVMIELGITSANPARAVAPPAYTPYPLRRVPATRDEAGAWLGACNPNTKAGQCDYALALLLLETDIRPLEVPTLNAGHYLQLEGEAVLVLPAPQGGLKRIALPGRTRAALEGYLARREVIEESPLFAGFPVSPIQAL